MKFIKKDKFLRFSVFLWGSALLILVLFNACQKEEVFKKGNVAELLTPEIEQLGDIFNIDKDIQFVLHHYKANGRFKLSHSYNREKYQNLNLLVNNEEIVFPEKRSVIYDEAAKFAEPCYGKNNKITFIVDEKEKLNYDLYFPPEIDIKMNTPYYVTPTETVLTWQPDGKTLTGIVIEYLDKKSNKRILNYDILPNNGRYKIPEKLFDNIPENSKIYMKLIQGNYLTDLKNSVNLVVFSLDFKVLPYTKINLNN